MKKITRRSFLAVCGAAAAAAALTACGGSASSAAASSVASSTASSAAASTASGSLSGNVATGGSTSMKNVIAALTEGFAEVEPGVTVSYDPTGSGAGITGATDKTLDIGLSSRALKDEEKNDVDGTVIALDGIAIIVNKASKVEDLTVDKLKQMFTGEITNWADVGGDDGKGSNRRYKENEKSKVLTVTGGDLPMLDYTVESLVSTVPSVFGYGDIFSVKFSAVSGSTETALNGQEKVYLWGKAVYDGGKEVIVDEISDKTLMEKISETAYQKYIYPRHFFGLPADAEIEATYFHFTNEDRSIVVTDPASGEDFLVSETVE